MIQYRNVPNDSNSDEAPGRKVARTAHTHKRTTEYPQRLHFVTAYAALRTATRSAKRRSSFGLNFSGKSKRYLARCMSAAAKFETSYAILQSIQKCPEYLLWSSTAKRHLESVRRTGALQRSNALH